MPAGKAKSRRLALVLALALAVLLAREARGQDSCRDCHTKEAALERGRVHGLAGISCTDCHGGDSSEATKEAAKATGTGYKGKLSRKAIALGCGECHADVRRMNPFGLPTDQLAQYRTSRHGEALFEDDDEKVATCADCHGFHGVVGGRSADSPVHATKIADTCGRCHSDATLIEEYGFDAKTGPGYRKSVHAHLLFDKNDASAPQCATCHGNHGAVPPGFANVGAVCGKCHVKQRELFEKSPHAKLVADGEFDACVACHGNHEIAVASPEILEAATCSLCHQTGDPALATRDRLTKALRTSRTAFAAAESDLSRGQRLGLATDADELLLATARTSLLEMEAMQHSLDPALLDRVAKETGATLARLSERLATAESFERTKRFVMLPVVLFLILVSFGFWVRFRRIHES